MVPGVRRGQNHILSQKAFFVFVIMALKKRKKLKTKTGVRKKYKRKQINSCKIQKITCQQFSQNGLILVSNVTNQLCDIMRVRFFYYIFFTTVKHFHTKIEFMRISYKFRYVIAFDPFLISYAQGPRLCASQLRCIHNIIIFLYGGKKPKTHFSADFSLEVFQKML